MRIDVMRVAGFNAPPDNSAPSRMQRRIAIAQTTMHWTLPDNVASMRLAMSLAQSRGAQLCGFSELAVTGFHRHITREATPQVVLPQRRGRGAGAALLAALAAHAAKVGPTQLYCGTRTAGSLILRSGWSVHEVTLHGDHVPTVFQSAASV